MSDPRSTTPDLGILDIPQELESTMVLALSLTRSRGQNTNDESQRPLVSKLYRVKFKKEQQIRANWQANPG